MEFDKLEERGGGDSTLEFYEWEFSTMDLLLGHC